MALDTHEELLENNEIYQGSISNPRQEAGGDFDENRGGEQA